MPGSESNVSHADGDIVCAPVAAQELFNRSKCFLVSPDNPQGPRALRRPGDQPKRCVDVIGVHSAVDVPVVIVECIETATHAVPVGVAAVVGAAGTGWEDVVYTVIHALPSGAWKLLR
jgi:hypothetical protein